MQVMQDGFKVEISLEEKSIRISMCRQWVRKMNVAETIKSRRTIHHRVDVILPIGLE